jgi:CheY-like chemotaxis protein
VALVLPVAAPDTRKAVGKRASRGVRPEGHETILVVEDESEVRDIAVRFLGALGYQVVAAGSAREALDRLLAPPQVDLLFSDVVLGSGMEGVELAHEARRIHPQLAVLLTSGYRGPGERLREQEASEHFELLRKPYRREDLANAIRHVLDVA